MRNGMKTAFLLRINAPLASASCKRSVGLLAAPIIQQVQPKSEVQLQRKLENARVARGCDASEIGRAQIRARRIEVGMIDDIEAFAARLQPELLRKGKLAAQSDIDAERSRGAQRVSAESAKCSHRIGNESRRVNPLRRRLHSGIRIAQNLIRPVASNRCQ